MPHSFFAGDIISIHAPRKGSDSKTIQKVDTCFVTNVHFAKPNGQESHLTRLLKIRFGENCPTIQPYFSANLPGKRCTLPLRTQRIKGSSG